MTAIWRCPRCTNTYDATGAVEPDVAWCNRHAAGRVAMVAVDETTHEDEE